MAFKFQSLEIPDVLLVHTERHQDARGFFQETFQETAFVDAGIQVKFVQDNHVRSTRGVLRGLHYQLPPQAQGKLVGLTSGEIFDVAVDLRIGGTTFGKTVTRRLNAASSELIWIPPGFAHGYLVLSDRADIVYKVSAEYSPELERGIRWNDPALGVDWPVVDPIISVKDRDQPVLELADNPFKI
tara:strand:- start:5779 stop:6333 length:555 start_codon:yes stop_codon:yes gene_type:complete